jgi:hypothetical protein
MVSDRTARVQLSRMIVSGSTESARRAGNTLARQTAVSTTTGAAS